MSRLVTLVADDIRGNAVAAEARDMIGAGR